MKKYKPSAEDIREIADLVSGGNTALSSTGVTNSLFYQYTQNAEHLDMSSIIETMGVSPATLLLMAQIAAKSPMLKLVDLNGNKLGEHAPEVAEALAKSHSISIVIFMDTDLGEHDLAVARAFEASGAVRHIGLDSDSSHSDAIKDIFRGHNDKIEQTLSLIESLELIPKCLIEIVQEYAKDTKFTYNYDDDDQASEALDYIHARAQLGNAEAGPLLVMNPFSFAFEDLVPKE
jgi:hypothetical protein